MQYPIRKITADDKQQFLKTMSVPFGMDPTPGMTARFQIAMETAELRAAFDGGQMISTFGAYPLNLTVPGGNSVPTAGTTLVSVLATHRRQGVLTAHMRQHFQEALEQGQPLAALWASESHIYGRFGYGPAAEGARITIQKPCAALIEPIDIRGSMRLLEVEEALNSFPDLFRRIMKTRPGMFERSPEWWKIRILADPEEMRRGATSHRRVLHVRDGEPVGYAIYRTHPAFSHQPAELQVVELFGLDALAERALWQYMFGVDLIATITHWNLPVDDPLSWWVEQPRELKRLLTDSIWVRPVNLIDALNERRYSAKGDLVFEFQDDFCPWNQGTFRLHVSADGQGHCEKTSDPTELTLTPYTLGSIYLGGHPVRPLAKAGLITGSPEAIHKADALFAWTNKPWCQEVF
jgi:predicted acetyltransferase